MFRKLRRNAFKLITWINFAERRYDKDRNGLPDKVDEFIEKAIEIDNKGFFRGVLAGGGLVLI